VGQDLDNPPLSQTITINEAKAASNYSPFVRQIARACRGLVLLTKRLEPVLEETPLKVPLAVFNGIAEVVQVRLAL